jgi:hypothetical protein
MGSGLFLLSLSHCISLRAFSDRFLCLHASATQAAPRRPAEYHCPGGCAVVEMVLGVILAQSFEVEVRRPSVSLAK